MLYLKKYMPTLLFSVQVFLIGCLGALAPEIIRLYNLRTKSSGLKWSNFYVFISVLFSLLGGVVALILPSTSYHGAFYAGIAAPTLITTFQRNKDSLFSRNKEDEAVANALPAKRNLSELFQDYWQAL
jgi:hypothetical protein